MGFNSQGFVIDNCLVALPLCSLIGPQRPSNIYLTDSDEEAIVDENHEESFDKTSEHFQDKARKNCLWERFTSSRNVSMKVCKFWFLYQMTSKGKLTQCKSSKALKEMTERQNWIQDKFIFFKIHIRWKGLSKSSSSSPQ